MTMKDKHERDAGPTQDDLGQFPDVPDPDPVTSIQVSIADDGTLSVDVDPAVVAPGGTVVWHTPPDEQRSFRVLFEAGTPLGNNDQTAMLAARKGASKSGGTTSGVLQSGAMLQSKSEQVVRARVSPDAVEKMWDCILETDAGKPGFPQRVFTGIIVRPPKK